MFDVSATLSPEKSAKSLGSRLAALREAKDLPLEKAARETRIPTQRLREIENDDLSHFSHPSYARLFLVDYAKYLGVPIEEIRGILPAPGACGSEGYQYLEQEGSKPIRHRIRRAPHPRRIMRAVTLSAVGLVLVIVSVVGIYFVHKIDRLKPSRPDSQAVVPSHPDLQAVAQGDHAALALPDANPAPVAAETQESQPVSEDSSTAAPAAAAPPTANNGDISPVPLYVGGAIGHGNAVQ